MDRLKSLSASGTKEVARDLMGAADQAKRLATTGASLGASQVSYAGH